MFWWYIYRSIPICSWKWMNFSCIKSCNLIQVLCSLWWIIKLPYMVSSPCIVMPIYGCIYSLMFPYLVVQCSDVFPKQLSIKDIKRVILISTVEIIVIFSWCYCFYLTCNKIPEYCDTQVSACHRKCQIFTGNHMPHIEALNPYAAGG